MRLLISLIAAGFFILINLPENGLAQDLVYQPKNPAFGGSPINYSWMLNAANTQNPYEGANGIRARDPLANFEESLQRQILSQLTRQLVQDRFGDIDLSRESSFEFGEFNIQVTPGVDGVSISIFNILSGEETTITIPTDF